METIFVAKVSFVNFRLFLHAAFFPDKWQEANVLFVQQLRIIIICE